MIAFSLSTFTAMSIMKSAGKKPRDTRPARLVPNVEIA